jgi:hypothetical protein
MLGLELGVLGGKPQALEAALAVFALERARRRGEASDKSQYLRVYLASSELAPLKQ